MFPYTLIRSFRKSLSIQVQKNGILMVRSPFFLTKKQIETFLLTKSTWIEKQREKQSRLSLQEKEEQQYYYLFGEKQERGIQSEKVIEQKMRKILRSYIEAQIENYVATLSLDRKPKKLRISQARTRWGSYSSSGTISFSLRLLRYSRESINAVIIHELAHMYEMNHSKKFWHRVETWMPEYQKYIEPLRTKVM
jgi:predicted metal-dependent hydrolase